MKRLLPLVFLLVFIAGCGTSSTYTFQCAFVTGRGPSDTYEIKQVLLPGEKVARDPDDQDWYVPCNRRNFIVDVEGNGDWTIPLSARTAPDEEGGLGTAIQGELSIYWELNRDRDVLRTFFEYCQKFACSDPEASSYETQAVTNNSSAGWMEMLFETMPSALERAFKIAAAEFDVGIVDEPARWPELATAMQDPFMTELRRVMGSNDINLFCASGSYEAQVCGPIPISIDALTIVDPRVVENRAEQARRLADLQLNLARVNDERALFEEQKALDNDRASHIASLYSQPGYADERRYQAQLELIQACAEAQQRCVVMIGEQGQAEVRLEVPTEP